MTGQPNNTRAARLAAHHSMTAAVDEHERKALSESLRQREMFGPKPQAEPEYPGDEAMLGYVLAGNPGATMEAAREWLERFPEFPL